MATAKKKAEPTPEATEEKVLDRDGALRQAYQTASKRLREAHLDEFNTYRKEEAEALGYEWTPPKTAKQKAAEQLAALLAAHPDLAEEVAGQPQFAAPTADSAEEVPGGEPTF